MLRKAWDPQSKGEHRCLQTEEAVYARHVATTTSYLQMLTESHKGRSDLGIDDAASSGRNVCHVC